MTAKCDRKKCLECTGCVAVCPFGAIDYINGLIVVDPKKCKECSACVKFCPVGAMSLGEA